MSENEEDVTPSEIATEVPRLEIKANGRRAALQALDVMLGKGENIQKLGEEFQDAFNIAPLAFFKDFVMPLLPKEAVVNLRGDVKSPIRVIHSTAAEEKTDAAEATGQDDSETGA